MWKVPRVINRAKFRIAGVVSVCSVLFIISTQFLSCGVTTHSPFSGITFASGSDFIAHQTINTFGGIFKQETGSTFSEGSIVFADGRLEDSDGQSVVSGTYDSTAALTLAGQRIIVDDLAPFDSITFSTSGNFISGNAVFSAAIQLQDVSTTLTTKLYGTLNQEIQLNSGTLYVDNNLALHSHTKIIGPGNCHLGGYRLSFGNQPLSFSNDLVWQGYGEVALNGDVSITGAWTCDGDVTINGNGNTLEIGTLGELLITNESRLTLHNVRIKGLDELSGAPGTYNFRCLGADSSIVVRSSTLELIGDFNFATGNINVEGESTFAGKGFDFNYLSAGSLTIQANAQLSFAPEFSFRYLSTSATKNKLVLADATSKLYLDGCTLHGTTTGFRLDTGKVVVANKVLLSSDATVLAEAIEFDPGLLVDINAASTLDVNGILLYG